MANAREIPSRMESVQDTRKVINVVYLISSAELKKSKELLEEIEPYFYNLQDLIRRILHHMSDAEHSYSNPRKEIREEDRVKGLIVVTGDKRLVGAYNHNVLKMAQEWIERSKNHRLYVVGELGRHYFEARHIQAEEQFHYTVQNPTMHHVRLIPFTILEDYEEGRLDEVWIIYTQTPNNMQMEAEMTAPLPLKREDFSNTVTPANIIQEEIRMVPSPSAAMGHVVPSYVTGFISGALVGSFCNEQNVKMMAMQPANDNANIILNDLSIEYNRARQATITQEITEVISSAKAQKKKHSQVRRYKRR